MLSNIIFSWYIVIVSIRCRTTIILWIVFLLNFCFFCESVFACIEICLRCFPYTCLSLKLHCHPPLTYTKAYLFFCSFPTKSFVYHCSSNHRAPYLHVFHVRLVIGYNSDQKVFMFTKNSLIPYEKLIDTTNCRTFPSLSIQNGSKLAPICIIIWFPIVSKLKLQYQAFTLAIIFLRW